MCKREMVEFLCKCQLLFVCLWFRYDAPAHSLKDSNVSKNENSGKKWIGGCSLIHNTSGVERHVEGLKLGQGRMTSESVIHENLHKLNNKLVSAWLEHFWCMYKPWAYMDSQNSPWPRLGEATTFPFIIFYMISHGGYI
jgi:hypothetical protein